MKKLEEKLSAAGEKAISLSDEKNLLKRIFPNKLVLGDIDALAAEVAKGKKELNDLQKTNNILQQKITTIESIAAKHNQIELNEEIRNEKKESSAKLEKANLKIQTLESENLQSSIEKEQLISKAGRYSHARRKRENLDHLKKLRENGVHPIAGEGSSREQA